MQLSLSKLSWQAQIGAFVAVCLCATAGFWHFFVRDAQAELATRRTRLTSLRADVGPRHGHGAPAARVRGPGRAARRPAPRACGRCCRKRRTSPTSCAGCRASRRSRTCRFSASRRSRRCSSRCTRRCRSSSRPKARTTTSAAFFERISKFPRIINISNISIKAKPQPEPDATIVAECIATTFVLQDAQLAGKKPVDGAQAAVACASRETRPSCSRCCSPRSSSSPRRRRRRPRPAATPAAAAGASRRTGARAPSGYSVQPGRPA